MDKGSVDLYPYHASLSINKWMKVQFICVLTVSICIPIFLFQVFVLVALGPLLILTLSVPLLMNIPLGVSSLVLIFKVARMRIRWDPESKWKTIGLTGLELFGILLKYGIFWGALYLDMTIFGIILIIIPLFLFGFILFLMGITLQIFQLDDGKNPVIGLTVNIVSIFLLAFMILPFISLITANYNTYDLLLLLNFLLLCVPFLNLISTYLLKRSFKNIAAKSADQYNVCLVKEEFDRSGSIDYRYRSYLHSTKAKPPGFSTLKLDPIFS